MDGFDRKKFRGTLNTNGNEESEDKLIRNGGVVSIAANLYTVEWDPLLGDIAGFMTVVYLVLNNHHVFPTTK